METFGNITLHHGDCMEVLRELPDNAFNLAIIDPPYFSGPERRQFYGKRVSSIGVTRLYAKSQNWEVPNARYFNELKRVARQYIVRGCNYYDYIFDHGRIVWDKCNGASSFSDCEIAATNIFNSVRLFPFMWNGMLQGKDMTNGRIVQGNKALNEKRIHPTQKPVALYAWLLNNYAKQGDKILDTRLGSGSSAIAAYELSFEFLGIEIDEHYYNAAKHRLVERQKQLKLF